jgi:hypothetical protein
MPPPRHLNRRTAGDRPKASVLCAELLSLALRAANGGMAPGMSQELFRGGFRSPSAARLAGHAALTVTVHVHSLLTEM